jgi:hypothetical protein
MMRIGFLLNIIAALTLLAVLYALSIFHGWV